MSSLAVAFRFPSGTQFRMLSELPKLGEVLHEGGEQWIVVALTRDEHGHTAVVLEHVDAPEQPQS